MNRCGRSATTTWAIPKQPRAQQQVLPHKARGNNSASFTLTLHFCPRDHRRMENGGAQTNAPFSFLLLAHEPSVFSLRHSAFSAKYIRERALRREVAAHSMHRHAGRGGR